MFYTKNIFSRIGPAVGAFTVLLVLGLLLAACQTYDGFPTAVPEPTVAPTIGPTATPTERVPLAPPPTFTPRPGLPTTPAGVQAQKAAVLKEGFEALLNNYFLKLDSADIYEVGLRSIQAGLEEAGVSSARVPIPNFGNQPEANWNSFLQAYTIALEQNKGKVNEENLAQLALLGATSSLQDCQSGYYPPNRSDDYLQLRTGRLSVVGIGINLQSAQRSDGRNVHLISRPISGGPAERAGLKMGDQISSIDGQNLDNKASDEVIQLLLGKTRGDAAIGTKVTLGIRRGNSPEQNLELTRARIQIPFMERQVLAGNVGYIRFNRFPFMEQQQLQTQTRALEGWLAEFSRAGVSKLVIDLRESGPGSISVMQTFLSYFLNGNELVYLSGSRRNDQNTSRQYGVLPMPSNSNVTATTLPLAVLVDNGTSAEAEIFAHAIQRNKRGKIVGQNTAGCLSASSPVALKDNSIVNVTVYRAVADPTKPESLVQEVQPDELAAPDSQQLIQGKDSQLEAALKVLNK